MAIESNMEKDVTIIGAGVVGLAIASELSSKYDNVFILEQNKRFGQETSSRNSEVIHAGIYYAPFSLKATLCVEGNRLIYEFCKKRNIPHKQCGKYIVATNHEEETELEKIRQKAINNNVDSLRLVTAKQLSQHEPSVKAIAGIWSPTTGVIDSHRYMRVLLAIAQKNNAKLFTNTKVTGVEKVGEHRYEIQVCYPDGQTDQFQTNYVINCAGLNADQIASFMGIDIDAAGYRQYFWKGEYFSLDSDQHKLKHLIYPVPLPQNVGLGIHTTIDVSGGVKLGPNAIFMNNKELDYTVSHESKDTFYRAVNKYLPGTKLTDLHPQMAGIRPKLQKPGDPVRDFIIREESDRGLPGVVNLIGIESPGLTSSLAIGKTVENLIANIN